MASEQSVPDDNQVLASPVLSAEKLRSLEDSFSRISKKTQGFSREYALMQEAEALKIPLDEYRCLYQLSLMQPIPSRFWKWTGFSEKKLWDYLQLLIVPALLAIGGYQLNEVTAARTDKSVRERNEHDQKIANERYQQDREIANDHYQQETLSNYLKDMTQLLLEQHLRDAKKGSESWSIARARTITVLWKLDSQHKGQLLQFLKEADLISRKRDTVIELKDTDLKRADLRNADLRFSSLKDADLRRALLHHANLENANLMGTHLEDADLSGADLKNADLKYASVGHNTLERTLQCNTVLPDGTVSNRDCAKWKQVSQK